MSSHIDFEKIANDLFSSQLPSFNSFHNKKYLGKKSGHTHQIDFSFEGQIAGTNFLLLGECKEYTSAVSLDRVMAFAYRIGDIGANKGIMVSSNNFQKGSFKIASCEGISLVVCRNKSLDVVLARSGNSEESVHTFFDGMFFDENIIEYGFLISDDKCIIQTADSVVNNLLLL
ncbi:restriction endonuclease [Hymenobacter yonginensis]|uniref:Restriction endonuclease n=1 Tax=Hymenobacter yonginensis TaxID=748197 RepID=A0ABY7PVB0_9BACT|nr:restriction endonuclease [Hymenobacter yonginensis]WBO86852.1 restriction endonuclease [Hymenobacter yonginensis]